MVFNLYIAALTALLVNYALGLQQSLAGEFPLTVIYVGIVSNLGAAAVLCKERFFNSKRLAPVADWLAISVFGSIGLLFVASVFWQGVFSSELW